MVTELLSLFSFVLTIRSIKIPQIPLSSLITKFAQLWKFRKGDVIQVTKVCDNGLWRGRINKKEGNFKFIDVELPISHQLKDLKVNLTFV